MWYRLESRGDLESERLRMARASRKTHHFIIIDNPLSRENDHRHATSRVGPGSRACVVDDVDTASFATTDILIRVIGVGTEEDRVARGNLLDRVTDGQAHVADEYDQRLRRAARM